MARNQTANRTISNLFALNRLRKDCYYEPIRVDFSPIEKPNNQSQTIIPQYNNDGHYFTSSFILPKQKILMEQQTLKNEKIKFEARISHYQRQIDEKTLQYKPTDNNYCQLCQQQFVCYWQHINSKYHKRMINSSKFNKDIMALCARWQSLNGKNKNEEKTKIIGKVNNCVKNNCKKGKNCRHEQKDVRSIHPILCYQQANPKQGIQTMESNLSQFKNNSFSHHKNLSPEEQKQLQQSLKITLQLNNHSTNLLSSNTFKQIFKQPSNLK